MSRRATMFLFSYQVTNFPFDPYKVDAYMLTLGWSWFIIYLFLVMFILFLKQIYLQCYTMSFHINDVGFCANDFYTFTYIKIHSHSYIHGDNENPYLIHNYKMCKITYKDIYMGLEEWFSLTSQKNSSMRR